MRFYTDQKAMLITLFIRSTIIRGSYHLIKIWANPHDYNYTNCYDQRK
jgi:hypothetical protein